MGLNFKLSDSGSRNEPLTHRLNIIRVKKLGIIPKKMRLILGPCVVSLYSEKCILGVKKLRG